MTLGGNFWDSYPDSVQGKGTYPDSGSLVGLCPVGKDICIDSGRQERVDFYCIGVAIFGVTLIQSVRSESANF